MSECSSRRCSRLENNPVAQEPALEPFNTAARGPSAARQPSVARARLTARLLRLGSSVSPVPTGRAIFFVFFFLLVLV